MNALAKQDTETNKIQEMKRDHNDEAFNDRSEVFIKYYNYYYQMLINNKNSGTEKSDK